MAAIPRSSSEITPELLQHLMDPKWPGVRVRKVSLTNEIHGTATKARLAVEYENLLQAPATIWLKAGWEAHSPMLGKVGIYACEPRAYLELLDALPVRVPACHGGAFDMDSLEGIVLLEDLAGEQVSLHTPKSHIPVAEAQAMLEMLAGMHAVSSAPDFFKRHSWVEPVFQGFGRPGDYKTYISDPDNIREFLRRPRSADYPPQAHNPQALHAAMAALADWARRPGTQHLLHGDAHIGNTYLTPDGPGLLDWQCVRRGGWAYDFTYYMVSALSIEDRRAAEQHLLESYLAVLSARGGPAVDWETAWADYQTCLVWGLVAWLSNSTDFQPELYNAIVSTRFAVAMTDHGLL